jgi:hypothetical protein
MNLSIISLTIYAIFHLGMFQWKYEKVLRDWHKLLLLHLTKNSIVLAVGQEGCLMLPYALRSKWLFNSKMFIVSLLVLFDCRGG